MAAYAMPSPLAMGSLGRLQSARTDRLALLSTPKERRRFPAGRPVSNQIPPLKLSDDKRRSQSDPMDFVMSSARGVLRATGWGDSPRVRALGVAGAPRTAPGSARSYAYAGHPSSHGISMQYRREDQTQSARNPTSELGDSNKTLVPKPPSISSPRRYQRPKLAPLRPRTEPKQPRSSKKRTTRSDTLWAAALGIVPQEAQKIQPADSDVSSTVQAPSVPASANWKQLQLHQQIRVLSNAKDEDEKWDAVLKPWLAKYDKARRWPGSIEERLDDARKEQAELREQEALRLQRLDKRAHQLLEELQVLGAS